jgi:uncharacterized phage protein (TIGR01671 family)
MQREARQEIRLKEAQERSALAQIFPRSVCKELLELSAGKINHLTPEPHTAPIMDLEDDMREIKFRAWDKTGKKMIGPNDFYQNADELPNGDKTGCHLSDFFDVNADGTVGKEHEDIVFMQFAGLKDKNGKMIYEGDIVSIKNTQTGEEIVRGTVKYFDTFFDVEVSAGHPWCVDVGVFNRSEVIGNIYENPDLPRV